MSIYTCAQNLLYDNTIPGFDTVIALITCESTSYKGNIYPQFWCRHVFVSSTTLVGVVIDADGNVCVC